MAMTATTVVCSAHSSRQHLDAARLSEDVALELVQRSIDFGHDHIAVARLCAAVHVGATVPQPVWDYCDEVVARTGDSRLRALFQLASQLALPRFLSGCETTYTN